MALFDGVWTALQAGLVSLGVGLPNPRRRWLAALVMGKVREIGPLTAETGQARRASHWLRLRFTWIVLGAVVVWWIAPALGRRAVPNTNRGF